MTGRLGVAGSYFELGVSDVTATTPKFTARLAIVASYFELGIADVIITTQIFNADVSNTIVFSQTVIGSNTTSPSVSNTITFSHSLSKSVIYSRTTVNTLSLTQTVTRPGLIHNQSVSNTITFTNVAIKTPAVFSHNELVFIQTVLTVLTTKVSNTLVFTQTVSLNRISNISVSNHLNLQSLVAFIRPVIQTMNTLTINQNVRVNVIRNISVNNILNIYQRIDDPQKQHLNISQSVSTVLVKKKSPFNQLNLSHSVQANVVYSRSVNNTINFRTGYTRNSEIPGLIINVTTAEGVIVKSLVILETDDTVIVLPAPILNDQESFDGGKVDLKKSVTDNTYTYIRHTNKHKLSYTFSLDYNKAKELVSFLVNNLSKIIKMKNFKGEIWLVHIFNSPFEFVYKTRAMLACSSLNERIEVKLEFVGEKQ